MIHVYCAFPIFREKCLVLTDALQRLGFEAEVAHELPRTGLLGPSGRRGRRGDDLWIGYWNWVERPSLPARYIMMQTEPLTVADAWWSSQPDWIPTIEGALEVWDYHDSNRSIIDGLGRPFVHVPCGSSPLHREWFDRASSEVGEPDIEVLFVGGMTHRRGDAVRRLREAGVDVTVVDYDGLSVGADLHRLVARSKLFLGIHRYEDPAGSLIDLFRFDFALSCGVPVLIERVETPTPFDRPFVDRLPSHGVDDIVDAVRAQLDDPDAARERAARTGEWFRSEYLIDRFLPVDRLQALLSR